MSVATSPFVWKGLIIKNVNVVQRTGKTPLIFVDLVDPVSFDSSGEYMFMPEDRNELCPPKGTKVDVYTKPGIYNGRPTLTFANIIPSVVSQHKTA